MSAKPWRGITPLHSTRSDVERILGRSNDTRQHWTTYQTDTKAISVLYANGLPCGRGSNSEWKLPKGTVISITVAPKTILLLSDLHIDESKYRKLSDPHKLNTTEYFDQEEGESISVVNGEISSLTYFAASSDSYLRCPNAPRSSNLVGRVSSPRFDNYGDLKFADEKARLDNFAIQLSQLPLTKGYIIVYPSQGMSAAQARARAKRAKSYLVRMRRIKANRLVTLNGEPIGQLTVELYIVPKGAQPPTPLRIRFSSSWEGK